MAEIQGYESWIASAATWVFANAHFFNIATLIGLGTLVFQLHGLLQASRSDQARLYLDIAQRWTQILRLLYHVRNNPPPSRQALEAQYPDPRLFMGTDQWIETYRPICNFFEDIGLMVKTRNISIRELKVLVTILDSDYLLLAPVIDYIRTNYRPDIYLFWNYLLERSAARSSNIDPFNGRQPYIPAPPGRTEQ